MNDAYMHVICQYFFMIIWERYVRNKTRLAVDTFPLLIMALEVEF